MGNAIHNYFMQILNAFIFYLVVHNFRTLGEPKEHTLNENTSNTKLNF
jgi:hypothetical protein